MASDDGYARAMAVAGRSLIANLSADRKLDLYVLDMGISDANKTAIAKSFESPQTTTIWVDSARSSVAGLPTMGWFTTATYARLLIPDLLPEKAERALYLDCDVIVRRCVGELYDGSMDGNLVGLAVPDMGAPFVTCPWGLAGWFEAGRSASDFNFNAGVMLMNLEAWRRERIGQQALDYVRSERHQLNQDQEALNAVVGTRIGAVDPRWNQQGELFQKPCAVVLPYPKSLVEQARTDPWIIHYSLYSKPWMHGCEHPWTAEWLKYLDQSAYSGWRPPGPNRRQRLVKSARKVAGRYGRRFGFL
jgi:lipopolysaccharide biosynthesis glycosyltransferase